MAEQALYIVTTVTEGPVPPSSPLIGIHKTLNAAIADSFKAEQSCIEGAASQGADVVSIERFVIGDTHHSCILFKDHSNRVHFWIQRVTF